MRKSIYRAWNSKTKEMIIQGDLDRIDKVLTYYELNTHVYVMQYTGLKTEDGTRIFEGDLLQPFRYTDEWFCEVYFIDGMYAFRPNGKLIQSKGPLYKNLERGNKARNPYILCGNIYQNPELLNESPPT